MSVDVVIPYRAGCPHRARALRWVFEHQPYPVLIGLAAGSEWVKADAVNPQIRASSADIIVVSDADVWTPGLKDAVEAVEAGAPWAIPHGGVFRLTENATSRILAGEEPREDLELAERAYRGVAGGGIVVARRETLLEVPLDPRFTGWGQEDIAWGNALTTIAGDPWRGKAPLYHLWHPPARRMTRRYGNEHGRDLGRRYAKALRDPAAMTRLLWEAA